MAPLAGSLVCPRLLALTFVVGVFGGVSGSVGREVVCDAVCMVWDSFVIRSDGPWLGVGPRLLRVLWLVVSLGSR